METTTQRRGAASTGRKAFSHNEGNGSLFYDAPGVPTLGGSLTYQGSHSLTAEPAVDKNQREYIRIDGDKVSGALYVNDRKENERHPDYTGPIEINGNKLRVSSWKKPIKSGDNAGQEFLSLAVSEPRPRPE